MSGDVATRAEASSIRPASERKGRIGAHLVIETLGGLGVDAIFGVPGVHALANWEAMRTAGSRYIGARTELAAAFAADGYSRASGRPVALALSTGPGTLISLAGLMEAATSYVPVIALGSQIDSTLLGQSRGALHELPDQLGSVSPIVKWTGQAKSMESIPALVAEAWETALRPPSGPTFLEIPTDLLNEPTDLPSIDTLPRDPRQRRMADVSGPVGHATALLERAERPLILAGGGVMRAGAWDNVREFAEQLDAPVVTTYMGKGTIPESHPLAGGSACDEEPFQEALRSADVVVCIGSELGEEATSAYSLRFDGELIQIDASAEHIGATHPALPLIGDAGGAVEALFAGLSDWRGKRDGTARASRLRSEIEAALASQGRDLERTLLHAIRTALPYEAIHCWDMTVLSYWAARDFPAQAPRRFLYPVGSGTLGYAWPAAIGASAAEPETPVLAVAGDGGIMYALQELASARQAGVRATLLIVDDGGYGILREYQRAKYGATYGVDLLGPDFLAVARAFDVEARLTDADALQADLEWAITQQEPTLLLLKESLQAPVTMD